MHTKWFLSQLRWDDIIFLVHFHVVLDCGRAYKMHINCSSFFTKNGRCSSFALSRRKTNIVQKSNLELWWKIVRMADLLPLYWMSRHFSSYVCIYIYICSQYVYTFTLLMKNTIIILWRLVCALVHQYVWNMKGNKKNWQTLGSLDILKWFFLLTLFSVRNQNYRFMPVSLSLSLSKQD
jgi:hypothetical protein